MLLIRGLGSGLVAGLNAVVDDDAAAAFEFQLTAGDDRVAHLNSRENGDLIPP